MRTAEQKDGRLDYTIDSILRHPLAYADTPIGIESMVLGLLELRRYARGNGVEPTDQQRMMSLWVKYARETIGYTGAFSPAGFMKNGNKIGDDWSGLTTLLRGFSYVV